MNRLYIIASTKQSGLAFAQLSLGLSEPQVSIITSIEEVNELPTNILYMHADDHPKDSVQISRELHDRGGLNLKDKAYIMSYINKLYTEVQLTNSLYASMTSNRSTEQGISRLTATFNGVGLTKLNGFEYTFGRDKSNLFFFIPNSDKMTVILNLYRAYVLNVVNKHNV